jgi:ATP-dependent DNA helicase RecG
MTKTQLAEIIMNGENSGIEFKRDTIDNRALAKEIVAFSNLNGGHVLLGVDDDGAVVGMRDYGYLEHMGMGIPRKIIRGMREHNGTEPDLIEDGERFILRLWKEKKQ